MKNRITIHDFIKANRKASREIEIEQFGKVPSRRSIHKSKKAYSRKSVKIEY